MVSFLWVDDEAVELSGPLDSQFQPRVPQPAAGTVTAYSTGVLQGAAGSKERSLLLLVQAIPGMIRHILSQRDCWTR